jgi:hypothetical protein
MLGALQRRDIALPQGGGISQTLSPPRKFFSLAPLCQEIRHEPGMAPGAIRERMDLDQPVMEAYSDLIGWICVVVGPGLGVVEQLAQGHGNLIKRYPEIAFARPEFPGPFPNVPKHLPVQFPDEFLGQQIALAAERLILRAGNVFLFGFVQFAAIGDVGRD